MNLTPVSACPFVVLVGCGNMGSALLRGWLHHNLRARICVVTPRQKSVSPYLKAENVTWVPHPAQLNENPDCIVLAVKPQILPWILSEYQRFVSDRTLFLSIAAGKTRNFFKHHLGQHLRIARAMPNMPAAIGLGVTLLVTDFSLSEQHRLYINQLMGAVGLVHWLADESMMNAGAALTGCGPAYLFQFMESLAEAGVSCGLSSEEAQKLCQSMILGSISYFRQSEKSPAALCDEVASPRGMTQAALDMLTKPAESGFGLTGLLTKGMMAAIQRARQMEEEQGG